MTTPWTRWRIIFLLMAFTFMGHLNRVSMSVAGSERIMEQFFISPTRMGMIYSAFLLTYTLSMTPAGLFADRFGVWLTLGAMGLGSGLLGAFTGLLGLGVVATSQLWVGLIVVRAMMGALNAPLHPSSARAVASWIPASQRGAANGLAVSAAALGIAGTYYIFGAMIDRVDWPGAFLVTGTVTTLLGLLWLVLAGDEPAGRRATLTRSIAPEASAPWSRLFLHRRLALLTLSYASVNYFEYIFFYWMIYYFGTVLTLGQERSRFFSTIVGLAMAVGMLSGGFVTDRLERAWGHRRGRAFVPIAGMLTGALMLGLGVMAATPAWIVLWFGLALGTVTAAEASFWMTAVELGRDKGTTAAGICNTGGNVGGLLAPMVTPSVGITFGWPWAMALGALVIFIGAFVWLWILPPDDAPVSGSIEGGSTRVRKA